MAAQPVPMEPAINADMRSTERPSLSKEAIGVL